MLALPMLLGVAATAPSPWQLLLGIAALAGYLAASTAQAWLVVGGARPGTPRDLANSLAQTAVALVLVPAAAVVSGAWQTEAVVGATVVAAGYLVGSVLAVRSVIRERGNRGFVAFSVAFHAAFLIVAMVALPWPYAACAAGLLARAVALPFVERSRAGTSRPLRPVQIGLVEMVASTVLVIVAFVVPL